METVASCRLCSFTCNEYKLLYDPSGGTSEAYEVTIKYFHTWLLDDAETETPSTIKAICLACWQHIIDFHNFQQWILNSRGQENLKFIIKEDPSEQSNDFEIQSTVINTIETDEAMLGSNDFETVPEEIAMFECDLCKELFQSYNKLNVHYKLCRHNNKSTNEDQNVKIINEINENAFKCKTCGASFSHYGSLRRHIRKQHPTQPLLKFVCKYCNKLFKKRAFLEIHKTKVHKWQYGSNARNNEKQVVDNKENNVESGNLRQNEVCQKFEEEYLNRDIAGDATYTSTQIQRPALEIVDVKSEISSDEETADGMNSRNSNEFYAESKEKVDNNLQVQNTTLDCPKCSQLVGNYIQLKEHFELKHPNEPCYINCCQLVFYEPQSILEHLQYHTNPNAYKCTECSKSFKCRKGLSAHKLQVHSNNRSTYHLHMCCCKVDDELCDKSLAKDQHMRYDKRACCERKKKILANDELIAKWRKELTCEICKANFPYYSLLRTHSYYEHPGEKCYLLCCQRKMSRISDTLEHVLVHLNPHLYRCQNCNMDFSSKNTLARHMRKAHKDALLPKQEWACDECDKTFVIRQVLTRHKNVCHSKKNPD